MSREIKFRGLRTDGKGWVYGSLVTNEVATRIVEDFTLSSTDEYGLNKCGGYFYLVNKETVGQFTGLKDKNGVDIYAGDKFQGDEPDEYYLIEWNDDEAKFQANLYGHNIYYGEGSQEIYDPEITCIDTNCFELSALALDEIIGNIHESEIQS